MKFKFNTIEEAIADIKAGKIIIVVDDENRENEGDLIIAAEKVSAEAINFMSKHGRGLICMPMTSEKLESLRIPDMVNRNTSSQRTAFTVSIGASRDMTTGISARDRAHTIRTAVSPDARPEDLVSPGHVFPLRAKPGGVLERAGHTEAAVDLARMAGLEPAGVICEIMKDDGTMARVPDLMKFAQEFDMKIITVAELIRYRLKTEKFVLRQAEATLPTPFGEFRIIGYKNQLDGKEHVALVLGEVEGKENILVRVHSECLTGDTLFSLRCDCGPQLEKSLEMIAAEKKGVLVYLKQEGRGIGLVNKIKAYSLQDQGMDTVEANEKLGFEADLREYGVGAQILSDLKLHSIRLLTNNPKKLVGIEGYGLKIIGRVPLIIEPGEYNKSYLAVKSAKLGHLFGHSSAS